MSLPIIGHPGLVSIYGPGSATGTAGISAPIGFLFGVVDQVWDAGGLPPFVGQSVMFKGEDIVKVLNAGWPYLLIDRDKIKIIDYPL